MNNKSNNRTVVIDIGNTSVHIATWYADEIKTPISTPTVDTARVEEALLAHYDAIPRAAAPATVICSVVPTVLESISRIVSDRFDRAPLVIGGAIPLPMDVAVDDRSELGVDRVCAAFAAYDKLKTACTVIDFGTAVTVDLIDDQGVFVGGAIIPGLHMQLRALAEQTAALPANVDPAFPQRPYGRNTVEAMQTGVCRGLVGAVRALVEGYASRLGNWPTVIATGGDLPLMGPHCDFLDKQVSHLTLRGVGRTYTAFLEARGL